MRSLMLPAAIFLYGITCVCAAWGAPHADAKRGKRLFLRDGCYACHGTQGAGGGIAGPQLAPDPPPFEAVLAQLRAPANRMPLYTKKVLSDADAADIYAYLKSIPPGRPSSRIPLLNLSSMSKEGVRASGKRRHSSISSGD